MRILDLSPGWWQRGDVMGVATILSAYPLDRAGVDYLLEDYSPRCELMWMAEEGNRCGRYMGAGRGTFIGWDDWRQVIVEMEPLSDFWEKDPDYIKSVQKALGTRRFGPKVDPQTMLIFMYSEQTMVDAISFEGVPIQRPGPLSNHGWELTVEIANILASWGPTVIDDHTVEGVHHLERGQWLREGPGYRINMQTGQWERP